MGPRRFLRLRHKARADVVTPLWEVFVRARRGVSHVHVGSVHADDCEMALQRARDLFTRRGEGVSLWVVAASAIIVSNPDDKGMLFEPGADKIERNASHYVLPPEIGNL